jgi:hypothetical protein
MKLTKRRSSPYLPVPSSLWIPDSHHPSPSPSFYTTSLGSRSTTSLLPKRLPFRRRGQSAGPELQLRNENFGFGPDYEYGVEEAQTHIQQTGGIEVEGNVFATYLYDDNLRRRPVYSRSISAVECKMDMVEVVDDRKRDSTGQNPYPPNSLAPGSGWGFGRMRRSRKQDLKIDMPKRVESLRYVKSLLS